MQQLFPSLEAFENIFLGLGELAVFFVIVALIRRRAVNVAALGWSLLGIFIAHTALFMHPFPWWPGHWNWEGKILSIVATLACIWFFPGISWKEAGFTWKQQGDFLKSCAGVALFVILAWAFDFFMQGMHFKSPDAETLAFQATMPGFNEEPLYRGLALFFINRAFMDEGIDFWGARLGWGVLITSLWFGLIHGVGIGNGHFGMSLITVAIVSVHGFFLAFIRMRTGSLLLGAVTHNVFNVGNQFIA